MVGRVYRTLSCMRYRRGRRHPIPVLKVTLYNVVGEKVAENLEVPVDTGYEGSIMLTADLYEAFQIAELPRSLWRTYKTLTGPITMRMARAIIEIDGINIECLVESPLFGGGKLLVGREILNKLVIIMDGDRGELCLGEAYRSR